MLSICSKLHANEYLKRLPIQTSVPGSFFFAMSVSSNGIKGETNKSESNRVVVGGRQKRTNDVEKKS